VTDGSGGAITPRSAAACARPRARGDGPNLAQLIRQASTLPTRPRGWSAEALRITTRAEVAPAPHGYRLWA
jgi:hypothetical protein